MAEENQPQPAEAGKKGRGKLVPVLLGAVLVVGAAVGVVAVTAPSRATPPGPVDVDSLPAMRGDEPLVWTFNIVGEGARGLGKLEVSFDYKAPDPQLARRMIAGGRDRAVSEVRLLLLSKTKGQLSSADGVIQLKLELQRILDRAFFPDGKGKVADVYILELIFQ